MADLSKITCPNGTTVDILSKTTRGIVRATMESTSTSTAFVVTAPGITSLYDGATFICKNTIVASASGCTIDVNGLGAKSMWATYQNSAVTTMFAKNQTYLFIFDYTNDRWDVYDGKDTNDNDRHTIWNAYSHPVAGVNGLKKYSLFARLADGTYSSFFTNTGGTGTKTFDTETEFDFSKVFYANISEDIAAGSVMTGDSTWYQCGSTDMRYSFTGVKTSASTSSLYADAPVYLRVSCSSTKPGFFKLVSPYFTQTPTFNGGIYVFLGYMRDSYRMELHIHNPIYNCRAVTVDGTTTYVLDPWFEGIGNKTLNPNSHAEGYYNIAAGDNAHVEGAWNTASDINAHAEGNYTTASGNTSHAEGGRTTASGSCAHAEGYYVTASGNNSHAEGARRNVGTEEDPVYMGKATGYASHSEGYGCDATGYCSHAEGGQTIASGPASHAEGDGTIAAGSNQHVSGKFNIADDNDNYAEIVGNGNSNTRSNARTLDWAGNESLLGNLKFMECDATTPITNYPVNMIEPGIVWKEKGYGDKFEIKPKFYGNNDENKLMVNASYGAAGTNPDVATVMHIDPLGDFGFGRDVYETWWNFNCNSSTNNVKIKITFPENNWAKYHVEVIATANFAYIHSRIFVGMNDQNSINICGYTNETPTWTTVSGCSAVTNNAALTWTADKTNRILTSSAFGKYGMAMVRITSSVNPVYNRIKVERIDG